LVELRPQSVGNIGGVVAGLTRQCEHFLVGELKQFVHNVVRQPGQRLSVVSGVHDGKPSGNRRFIRRRISLRLLSYAVSSRPLSSRSSDLVMRAISPSNKSRATSSSSKSDNKADRCN